jgi:hypothetical protein
MTFIAVCLLVGLFVGVIWGLFQVGRLAAWVGLVAFIAHFGSHPNEPGEAALIGVLVAVAWIVLREFLRAVFGAGRTAAR